MPPRNPDFDVAFDPLELQTNDDHVNAGGIAPVVTEATHEQKRPPRRIVWRNVVLFTLLHAYSLWGIICIPWAHPLTWLFTIFLYTASAIGVTAGAHRLWAHRSYKAKLPMRIILTMMNSMALQNDIIEWARDHRVHHKYSETDADPHNARRGFFFSHIGWLLVRKHPDVKDKGKNIDLSDLYADPVLRFQRKYYVPSVLLMCFLIPTLVPHFLWGESLWYAFLIPGLLRLCATLNATWMVNSVAHMKGDKPYNKFINPVENIFVIFGAVGEGFHNYHHTFPHDYSTSEFGWKFNLTTFFIDCFAKMGLATDRRKMPYNLVFRRALKTGDGSHHGVQKHLQETEANEEKTLESEKPKDE
ncbi:unnamed protein product [Owenia fusiformis]|uniref:Uncharacterized protein n=2 Tax=Owenia fusiformis TaxID=6347 RepID=A0A8J1XZJ9_OWEFU|nr:unnamed protein product [Owenia fusiformis]